MAGIDFGSVFSGAGINLQQQVLGSFGAVVDQFSSQSSSGLFGGMMGSSGGANPYIPGEWNGTNYAEDLLKYQPKHHFMFRVMFEMDPAFTNLVQGRKDVFQYVVKKISRPGINFEYEPVNYYNFKTQVLKTIHFEAVDMTMIDDIQDTFHNFARSYLMSYSPLSRSYNSSQSIQQLEEGGFNFSDAPGSGQDSAIRGVLAAGKINPLKSIKIIQYFGHGSAQNTFVFINPKITSITYDEAHHENGEGNHASIKFDYDGMYMESAEQSSGRSPYAVPGRDMYGNIPNDYIGTGDPYFNSAASLGLGSLSNGIGGILGGMAQTVSAQSLSGITNPYLSQALRNVSSNAVYGIQGSARNTLFSTVGGNGPNYNIINSPNSGFVNGIIAE
jgi:peptide deformylase